MPAASKKSYGSIPQARARKLLQAILEGVDREDRGCGLKFNADWAEVCPPRLTIETTLQALTLIANPQLQANTPEFKKAKTQTGEALGDLRDFVGILDDHRTQKKGSDRWHFSLRLWNKKVERNLEAFDQLWESRRSSNSKTQTTTPITAQQATQSLMRPGAPMPGVRLPENFVARPGALAAVKERLLAEGERTLVVSAIAGLGGLGKSVLATAIVLDPEVQGRFADGILWVTLGQNPDLLGLVGDWIRTLDRSKESLSATTLEGAKGYLQSLLAERRMLLVVDDVWNAAHAEWFRVGGAGCRVLVTTREAQLAGADYYALDLMTEAEAIELVRRKLKRAWSEGQAEAVRRFARVVGFLPLALDLSANLVAEGLSWGELQAEFEDERRAVALELLDSSESFELMAAAEREREERKYSLKACFNLSLRRLNPEQLRRFAWLGVLPEDVRIDGRMVRTLWDVREVEAKKGLIELCKRSFLTGAGESEGYGLYRVHDLMHDTARGLIESGCLAGVESLAAAHGAFVGRYGKLEAGAYLLGLPKDGYIHRHLTWHLVMAGREAAVHKLLGLSDGAGRNAWFEACEEIGEPGIFVQDVQRAWELAEALYRQEPERSIVLQGRYAFITATLNTLLDQLPAGVMAAFVKGGFWSVERAWAYVEQMQNEWTIGVAIEALATYLTKSLLQIAVEKARSIQDEYSRARVLTALAKHDQADFSQLLQAARSIQDEYSRAEVLTALAKLGQADFSQLLEAARSIQDEYSRAEVLTALAKLEQADFSQLLEAARSIQDESSRAEVLTELAKLNQADFSEALEAARLIQDEYSRAIVLTELAKLNQADFSEALEAARLIQDEYSRAIVLTELAKLNQADFSEALEAARSIKSESSRAIVLTALAKLEQADFSEALEAARSIKSESSRAIVLTALAKLEQADFSEALEAARSIKSESSRAIVLTALAKLEQADFSEALQAARSIQDESSRAKVLTALAKHDQADFSQLLQAARSIRYESSRAEVLTALAKHDQADFSQLLQAARSIQDESSRAEVLTALAKHDQADFSEALEAARSIQDEYSRARVLIALAKLDQADFLQLLQAARSIQDERSRARVLTALAKHDQADFSEALQAARSIQDKYSRAMVLTALAKHDQADFSEALEAARSIQNEDRRARVLTALAKLEQADFSQLLEAARSIDDEYGCARVLTALAKLDHADFSQLLEAARLIQDEYGCARVLTALAKLEQADFSEALQAAHSIHDESKRAEVLSSLAQIDNADDLPQVYQAIHSLTQPNALTTCLPHLPLTEILPRWHPLLHTLAKGTRADLMTALGHLAPAIQEMGGAGALRGIVDEMQRICRQWK
ncbi:NB-ARC domain-containing protein [Alkalinema pantanalense CENA528]|uniref:NB-ARC domain-containing protein n=1 Tax=Alkalinema pantanalense TaxID=1620705 RepID=UPI003D6E178F